MNLLTEFTKVKHSILFASICLFALCSNQSFAQTCPVQASPPTQTDLSQCMPALADCDPPGLLVIDAFLEGDTPFCAPCVAGEALSMNINLNIVNQTENANVLGLFGDISNGMSTCTVNMCSPAIVPKSMTPDGSGAQVVAIGPLNYICGETLTLTNLSIVSAAVGATCPIACTDVPSHCNIAVSDLVMTPPLVPATCGKTIAVACNDLNPCTAFDTELVDACTGAICMPCTGSGTADDCFVVNLIPCNDYNPCTENDMQSIDACSGDICSPCTGTPIASCSIFINQACNDYNPCTTNDVIVLDACTLEICEPCAGTLVDEPICNSDCEVYNPATCSCDPIPVPSCDDYNCNTIDTYDPTLCECVYITIDPSSCDDGLCYTNDYFDPYTCNCVNDPIVVVDCDDYDCSTQDVYNYSTCTCEHIDVCSNVTNGGWIGYDQGNCGPFNPAPIYSLEPAYGGCGDIEYMWLVSSVNVPYYGNSNSPWTVIPGANGITYDPPYQSSGTKCYLRCARTDTCDDFPGESNVICITVGQVQNCNDWDCTTEDYFNPVTCECEYTVISSPNCDDNNCGTTDYFNAETCECEYTPVCNNVTFPGNISGNQESCGPFDANIIANVNSPSGGCGNIEYIWIKSHTNVFSGGGTGSPWSTIPGANGPSYDPGFVSQTTYYRRCARSSGCLYYIGESNIICIEIGISETCDDGNCNTLDTFDPDSCECIHINITPDCDDNDCSTDDFYDAAICQCFHVAVTPPDCDDNDCNTIDTYDNNTCNCVYTVIPPPDCDDNDCTTTDLYDVLTCECANILNPPVNCDDNDCTTTDIYNASTCECEYVDVILPDCDDDDCTTIDEYDPLTCNCTNTSIEVDNCDDNDCNTNDFYDVVNCECVYEVIPPPDCDDNNCNTTDSYNSSTCLCENVVIDIPDCDDNNCNTDDLYDVTTCECVNTLIPPPDCDDNDCNTTDSYDAMTCNCVFTVIPPPDCDDGDCNTDDFYDVDSCECINTISQLPDCDDNDCNTDDFYDVTNCECINTLIPPPNCDDNDCTTNDFYNATTCTCVNDPITPQDCDDNDCNTADSYDSVTCTCVNDPIPPPDCDDSDCTTEDSYDAVNCICINDPITPPDCDDNDCNTADSYDSVTCTCVNDPIPPPDCDDNDCTTEDSYDAVNCICINDPITPPDCDDNDCNTADSYDTVTCTCVNDPIPPPDCDDNDCNTMDSYDAVTCTCVNDPIPPPDCDDNDCTTLDEYDEATCECINTVVPQEIVCSTVGVFDLILDDEGNGFITAADIDDGSSVGCDGTLMLSIDLTDFACNNIGANTVKLTVSNGMEEECCFAVVNVIDNSTPSLLAGFCPPDETIDCGDDTSDLSIFGDVNFNFLDDNCPLNFGVIESSFVDLDGCGIGFITRTFTLIDELGDVVFGTNGQELSCEQTITVAATPTPITLADITFPPAVVNLDCNDPLPTSEPTVDETGNICSFVTISSNDVIVNPNDECNFTIERTFTIIDVCADPDGVFTFTQSINISDSTAPTINISPNDQVIDLTGQPNECSTVVTFNYNITDDCIANQDLIISIDAPGLVSQTNINANGGISFDVEFCTIDEEVTIILTAEDGCGNLVTESFDVMITGGDCVEFMCQKFIFGLDPDGSNDFISNDFPVVNNSCGTVDVSISYDPMNIQDTVVTYGCDEIEANGLNPNIDEFLYFFIDGELVDSCRIVIFFSNDPNGDGDPSDGWVEICGFNNFAGTVSGTVSSIMAEPVSNVNMTLEGSYFEDEKTDEFGVYAFPIMEFGGNYKVIPKKNGDYLNGVSTLDIILIQKHILALKEFDSPYKYIAGDVNKSETISSLDIIILRKLILGFYDELPNNESWRMVDKEFEFPDPSDPLSSGFPETYNINEMSSSMYIEFVGVKVGDVNGSVMNEFSNVSSESRSDSRLDVTYGEKQFKKGEEFEITFSPKFKSGFDGAQFAIQFDQSILEIQDVMLKDNALCNLENINLLHVDEGLILVSYNSLTRLENNRDQSFFTVRVKSKSNNSISRAIAMDDTAIKSESYFYDMVGDIMLMPTDDENGGVILYQNKPNPWNYNTTIQYFVPEDMPVILNIYSINGQIIRTDNIEANAGMNEYDLNRSDISTNGVFYYEIVTEGTKQVRKMLLLD